MYSMRFFVSIIAVFFIGTHESIAQEISGEESLRDRSRILKKVNPVSSETAEFSDFSELSASDDAEEDPLACSVDCVSVLWIHFAS